jgi:hypothetical protein
MYLFSHHYSVFIVFASVSVSTQDNLDDTLSEHFSGKIEFAFSTECIIDHLVNALVLLLIECFGTTLQEQNVIFHGIHVPFRRDVGHI